MEITVDFISVIVGKDFLLFIDYKVKTFCLLGKIIVKKMRLIIFVLCFCSLLDKKKGLIFDGLSFI